jgi:hypothetical protein
MLNTNYAKLAGEQLAKYPFDDVAYTLWTGKPHCGGGSGGSLESSNYRGGSGYQGIVYIRIPVIQ